MTTANNNGSPKPTNNGGEPTQSQGGEEEPPEQSKNEGQPRQNGTSDEKGESTSWDCPIVFAILGLVAAAAFAGFALSMGKAAAALVALALIPPFLFVSFERYVNKPDPDSSDDDSENYYRPNLRIWGYGIVLGAGLVVLYLLTKVVLFSVGNAPAELAPSTSAIAESAVTGATDTTATVADSSIVNLMGRSAEVASLGLWQNGLLLFFLSAALAIVMYALISVSRSEI